MKAQTQPFLKWAGGKRWFVQSHSDLLPERFNCYIEPFLGGGSIFLHLRPKKGVLGDLNAELIEVYRVIRDEPAEVREGLELFQKLHSSEFFYRTRESDPVDPLARVIRFLYLNRTCWNGLYRVNKCGKFNVPIGTKSKVVLPTDSFDLISEALNGIELLPQSFERTLALATAGDFVFLDPPYTVKHNHNGFVKYNDHIFSWGDQLRLRDEVGRLASLGVKILMTNAYHPSILDLYDDVGELAALGRRSVLAGRADKRAQVDELVLKINY